MSGNGPDIATTRRHGDESAFQGVSVSENPFAAQNIAFVNNTLLSVVSDLYELENILTASSKDDMGGDNRLTNALHAFRAVTILRINSFLQVSEESSLSGKVVDCLEKCKDCFGVRFLEDEDVRQEASQLISNLWESLSEIALVKKGFHVRQYGSDGVPVTEELYNKLVELAQQLVIDFDVNEPQRGYATRYTVEDFKEWLAPSSARVFMIHHNGEDIGYFLAINSEEEFPDEVKERLKDLREQYPEKFREVSWLPVVGILPGKQVGVYKATGFAPYELLATALSQSCYSLGKDTFFGEVRLGSQANLAIKGHQRIGFEKVGEVFDIHGVPFSSIALDPGEAFFLANPSLVTDDIERAGMFDNSKAKLPSVGEILEQWNYRDPSSVQKNEFCAPNGDKSDIEWAIREHGLERLKVSHSQLIDGYAVKFIETGLHLTIRQLVPNQDIWTCDFESDRIKTMTFRDALRAVRRSLYHH